MSTARHPHFFPAATDGVTITGPGASPSASATMTGSDGTVLIQISRHTEYPVGDSGEGPLAVLDVAGDIDAQTAPLLHAALIQAIRGNRRVCCDLSQVGFLSAAAVRTLLAAVREGDTAGRVFTVRGVHGFGVRVFQLTGLDAVLASRAMNPPGGAAALSASS